MSRKDINIQKEKEALKATASVSQGAKIISEEKQ